MANTEPLIKLQTGGSPAYLSYDVPEPTSHYGQLAIDFGVTSDFYITPPPLSAPVNYYDDLNAIRLAMRAGFTSTEFFPGLEVPPNFLIYVEDGDGWQYEHMSGDAGEVNILGPFRGVIAVGRHSWDGGYGAYIGRYCHWGRYGAGGDPFVSWELSSLTPEIVQMQLKAGNRLSIYTDTAGRYQMKWVEYRRTMAVVPRLVLLEKHRFSSHLGNYGAGRVVQTFTLLPGEKTKITIKTYKRSSSTTKSTQSVFDSSTQDSTQDFANAVTAEHSDKQEKKESLKWHVEAEAEVNYGFVAAKVSANYKGGTNSARDQFAKEVNSASQKHAAKTSSRRDVRVDQTEETRMEEGEESGIERDIQNINTGRTLNFVFRQMNQEFISLLHLVDVQLGYTNGHPGNLKRFPIANIKEAVDLAIKDELCTSVPTTDPNYNRNKRDIVRDKILAELQNIFDYSGAARQLIEKRVITTVNGVETSYYRVKNEQTSTYTTSTGKQIKVQGILLAAGTIVMRTAGIMVEALLGQGEGLDDYSKKLQGEAARAKRSENDLLAAQIERKKLVNQVATTRDAAAARLYTMLYPSESPPPLPSGAEEKTTG